jgi:hypothetical protein
MARPGRKKRGAPAGPGEPSRSSVREGGTHLSVRNSGLEVWLYDDANRERIRLAGSQDSGFGGLPPDVPALMRQGLVLGYSLQQDDDLEIAVHVGDPLRSAEMAAARWLEPQLAFLSLPSGRLCVESNDASRIGPDRPTEKGALVDVPPGDYRVTLYRIDREAMLRDGLSWHGPQEVVVLTPGGSPADAAGDLLPFEPRRDTSWVGRYTIDGSRAEALAWFPDYWDTFTLNLDAAAVSTLALVPGTYIRTTVPTLGITLIGVFAASWDDAQRVPPPKGVELEEYGYAALHRMDEWNGAEALFCRRQTTAMRVEQQHHCLWLPAVVEVLDVRPQEQAGGGLTATDLRKKEYFDPGFLTLILSDVLPEVADLDALPLPKALDRLDKKLARLGLAPQGDRSWQERIDARSAESSCRLYAGLPDGFAAIVAGEGSFELLFLSELDDGTWVVTGLADEIDRRIATTGPDGLPVPHPRIQLQTMDESLAKIAAAHKASLRQAAARPIPAPANLEECAAAFERFRSVAFG